MSDYNCEDCEKDDKEGFNYWRTWAPRSEGLRPDPASLLQNCGRPLLRQLWETH